MPTITSRLTRLTPGSLPTVQVLQNFLASFFPVKAKDVDFVYHVPRAGRFPSAVESVSHIVFSITPTEGVYKALDDRNARQPPVAFLHRPFGLDRRRVRRGSTVLSCHVGFDEVLTVGWNTVLAARLGVDVEQSICVQGYKGDPDRRIGIIGQVRSSAPTLVDLIRKEFGSIEGAFNVDNGEDASDVLCIMNAFHPEEVDRVMASAYAQKWITESDDGSRILYLTGQPREAGLTAALSKGVKVVCVGHRVCEEWGIRYLATRTRHEFPLLQVEEVYEDEPPRPLPAKKPTELQEKT